MEVAPTPVVDTEDESLRMFDHTDAAKEAKAKVKASAEHRAARDRPKFIAAE